MSNERQLDWRDGDGLSLLYCDDRIVGRVVKAKRTWVAHSAVSYAGGLQHPLDWHETKGLAQRQVERYLEGKSNGF